VNRLAVAALLALAASPALAESGRWGAIDIGAESYRPNVDAEFGSAPAGTVPPYEQMFGSGRGWMLRVGFARALYTGFGSLELGIRTGYFQDSGKGVLAGTTVPSGDKTTFKVVPTSLALTYRVDDFAERWNVPLAPYGRVTLERYNWWVNDGARLPRPDARPRVRPRRRREPHVPVLRGDPQLDRRLRVVHELGPLGRVGLARHGPDVRLLSRKAHAAVALACPARGGEGALRASGASAPAAPAGPSRGAGG